MVRVFLLQLSEIVDSLYLTFSKELWVSAILIKSIIEKDVESAIISHLQKFLLEMGKGFCFVDRQMHICTETSDFYLVFYNYILKCFVLIDLKSHKLTHQDIGQMDMYIRMFDDLKKQEDDNPTIGVLMIQREEFT